MQVKQQVKNSKWVWSPMESLQPHHLNCWLCWALLHKVSHLVCSSFQAYYSLEGHSEVQTPSFPETCCGNQASWTMGQKVSIHTIVSMVCKDNIYHKQTCCALSYWEGAAWLQGLGVFCSCPEVDTFLSPPEVAYWPCWEACLDPCWVPYLDPY